MTINDREISIVQYSLKEDWYKQIPNENWLCVIVEDDAPRRYLDEIICKIIEKNVCYVCCLGSTCERTHDMIDDEIVFREVDIDQLYLPSHMIMTTWHDSSLKEAMWDVVNVSFHESIDINKMVFLDMTNGSEKIEETLLTFKEK
jgi:hypothetical protein